MKMTNPVLIIAAFLSMPFTAYFITWGGLL